MAKNLNPAQVAADWVRGMQNAQEKYVRGVRGVTQAPTAKAAANAQKMVRNLKAVVDDGSYQSRCNAVSLADWQNAAADKGAGRLAEGAEKARPKMDRFFQVQLPTTLRIAEAVRAMPNNTEAERDQRMLTQIREMRKNKYSRLARSAA